MINALSQTEEELKILKFKFILIVLLRLTEERKELLRKHYNDEKTEYSEAKKTIRKI